MFNVCYCDNKTNLRMLRQERPSKVTIMKYMIGVFAGGREDYIDEIHISDSKGTYIKGKCLINETTHFSVHDLVSIVNDIPWVTGIKLNIFLGWDDDMIQMLRPGLKFIEVHDHRFDGTCFDVQRHTLVSVAGCHIWHSKEAYPKLRILNVKSHYGRFDPCWVRKQVPNLVRINVDGVPLKPHAWKNDYTVMNKCHCIELYTLTLQNRLKIAAGGVSLCVFRRYGVPRDVRRIILRIIHTFPRESWVIPDQWNDDDDMTYSIKWTPAMESKYELYHIMKRAETHLESVRHDVGRCEAKLATLKRTEENAQQDLNKKIKKLKSE